MEQPRLQNRKKHFAFVRIVSLAPPPAAYAQLLAEAVTKPRPAPSSLLYTLAVTPEVRVNHRGLWLNDMY